MKKNQFETRVIVTTVCCIILGVGFGLFSPPRLKKPQPFCTILPSTMTFVDTLPISWVGDTAYFWEKKTTLRIYFHDGTLDIQEKVLATASEWATLSGFTFEQVFAEAADPQIRISFSCAGYNSLVGKQNLDAQFAGRPTMCLEGLDTLTDQQEFNRTVLHEFGHVMGLLHELQSPVAQIPWDTVKLYAYYKRVYNWESDSVDKWVLSRYKAEDVRYSPHDDRSIMLYAVPDEVTKGSFAIPWPNKLSVRDKEFISEHYH